MSLIQAPARCVADIFGRESYLVRRLRPAYQSFLDWYAAGEGVPWKINGVSYRIDPRYRPAHNYERVLAAFLGERVRPGAISFNVGANVGIYVLQLAHWSRPTGRVVAFEPNPTALGILQHHVRLNGLASRVEIVPAAVGLKSGRATFYAVGADGTSRLGAPPEGLAHQASPLPVRVITLDDYCESNGLFPNVLLLDIEGCEIGALAGAREVIRRGRNYLTIVAEMHPHAWASAGTSRAEARELLADLGLRAVPLTGQWDPLAEHGLVHLAYESGAGPSGQDVVTSCRSGT